MDVQTIITAVNGALDTIAGLRVFDYPPDQIPVPAAVTELAAGQFVAYDTAMAGTADDLRLQVRLFVSTASNRAAAAALNTYLARSGASSIKAAIETNGALAALVHYVTVTGASGWGMYAAGDQQLLGCTFDVIVGCD
jgi:hypothetical protein